MSTNPSSNTVNDNDFALHIALYCPEIPPNAGNIGRLCVGLDLCLHIIHPIGFSMDEKAVRRAGLDYWKHVRLVEHADADAFFEWAVDRPLILYSSHGTQCFTSCEYQYGGVLLFGPESNGLPVELVQKYGAAKLPMTGPIRSLNLSNAVAVATYEALKHVRPQMFGTDALAQ